MRKFVFGLLIVFIAAAIPFQSFSNQVPEKVEPPFWWAGMQCPELQIMFHGKDIGLTRLEVNHPGVVVKEVVSVQSPNYLFVYLDLTNATPGTINFKFNSGKKTVYSHNFQLLERKENARYIEGFDASNVIYQIMPDRFANGNPNNDDMLGMLEKANRQDHNARHGGDIQGIVDNLNFVADVGYSALWITPLLENNQPRYSYHGYAITDFYKIDPRFGTNQEFVQMVAKAGEKGIKIIKDMVFNHCGLQHWWMKDLPSDDWLNQWPEFTRTTYRMTTLVDPYVAKSDRTFMLDGWFDRNMPDLNQRNRLLATYLIQNSIWWIEYSGIKGIRMDTQPYSDKYFMSDWGKRVMHEYPNFNIVGESWMGIPAMISYFQGGKQNHDGYDSNIPSVFDFSLYDEIKHAFTEKPGWASGLMRIYNSLVMDFLYPNPYNLLIFGDNHDTDRFFTRVGEDIPSLKLAIALILTTRGIPQIYTGTELLKTAYEHDGHGVMRSNFPGGWPGDPVNAFSQEGRTEEQNKVFDYIKKLIHFRNNNPVLHFGKLTHFLPQDNVYVYARHDENQRILVIINNNDSETQLEMARFAEVFKGASMATEAFTGIKHYTFDKWTLPAKAASIFVLE
jgi:glycosidase